MKLLADMGVAQSVVRELRVLGHDAIHVRECLSPTSEDIEIMDYAKKDGRVILTMDHDFGDLLFLRGACSPSLIFFRVTDEKPASILSKLKIVLGQFEEPLYAGAIITVEDQKNRVRLLPIKSDLPEIPPH